MKTDDLGFDQSRNRASFIGTFVYVAAFIILLSACAQEPAPRSVEGEPVGGQSPAEQEQEGEPVVGANLASGSQAKACSLSKFDLRAFHLYYTEGIGNQKKVAARLKEEFHLPCSQGSVSRMLKRAVEHMEQMGIKTAKPATGVSSVDPKVIELGQRRDHLTKRQRKKLTN